MTVSSMRCCTKHLRIIQNDEIMQMHLYDMYNNCTHTYMYHRENARTLEMVP